ncbi:hypothetical protein PLEOSDRAFT_162468 [Pleurotus ostreatus PC15]|uniref:Uncharacterized protein n=1 Tax=Pleurotus ostreatus (strain PC15) TaxID=1137138 RepID=A0A067N6M7_PLEO1|nr:hypothetical protein PLEOSDRAFT_162468 [Pleurotus ostreatus PC15]
MHRLPFANGPTGIELQVDWIAKCIEYMAKNSLIRIEASEKAEQDWTQRVHEVGAKGLWNRAKSWYRGANIPGKVVEDMFGAGGYPSYAKACTEVADSGYEGRRKHIRGRTLKAMYLPEFGRFYPRFMVLGAHLFFLDTLHVSAHNMLSAAHMGGV